MAATVVDISAHQLETKVLKAPGAVALDFYQARCPPCRALEPQSRGAACSRRPLSPAPAFVKFVWALGS